ncbi:MAG TPA: selenocysteine-specific translation elongation factor [Gemmatimonadaceae bacterium]|nr:selenocysteine-specific translation elongation factor [Gemmatimonadaceae bacterium]
MILGTAGHVDHGKTALVRALTGVDTDRWAEEKRRGITIDLGFASLPMRDGSVLGVVDVPGHEAFVRNMLAGATGVDLALLVVAADEGVMPQTREHLAILRILGTRGGVVALTKCDLVDEEWLELVRDDVRAAVEATPLAGAALCDTSVVDGRGLDDLREAIQSAAASIPSRTADDLFRLPVDRAFSVRGTGTVVTGTVWSGSVARDTAVRILPGELTARVRGIESHGAARAEASPGTRAAIALSGVDVSDLHRGSVLVSDRAWSASHSILAEVALLAEAPGVIGPRTKVRFHLGTMETGARVVASGGALAPGQRRQARIVLDEPVVARAGDRFVLRSASPLITMGGGVVNDPLPPHRRSRPWLRSAVSPEERIPPVVGSSLTRGVDVASLPVRTGAMPTELPALLAAASGIRRVGERIYAEDVLRSLAELATAAVDEFHARFPLEPGASLQSVRARLGVEAQVAEGVLNELARAGLVELRGAVVMRAGWSPAISPEAEAARVKLLDTLEAAGAEPPSVAELEERCGPDTAALLRLLERDGQVVQVESERYYAAPALGALVETLRAKTVPERAYTPAELRDLLGLSRKFLIPLLEYCDRSGITDRRGGERFVASVRN